MYTVGIRNERIDQTGDASWAHSRGTLVCTKLLVRPMHFTHLLFLVVASPTVYCARDREHRPRTKTICIILFS
jgi:hypothetical protein